MDSVSLEELKQINWIKNSDFISSMTEDNEDIVIDRQLIIPDILNDEPLDIVYSSINFFGGEPENFLDYIRKQIRDDFNELLRERPVNEHEYINKLKEFSSLDEDEISSWAAENGHIELLKYCKYKGYYFDEGICSISVGSLKCLKYLHESGFDIDVYTCYDAARYGKIDSLKYLVDKGCTINEKTCSEAVSNGHLNCLQYLHEHHFPWDKHTCSSAARNGHLDCLQYLHENGCPWDEETCNQASLYDEFDCLKYAVENGCTLTADIFNESIKYSKLEIIKYLHEKNCPWNRDIYTSMLFRQDENCLMFLFDNNYIEKRRACYIACKANSLKFLKYVLEHGCSYNKENCIRLTRSKEIKDYLNQL